MANVDRRENLAGKWDRQSKIDEKQKTRTRASVYRSTN
jgi:hypothetical protein